ncbi:SemiSWEET transporter [Sphingobacterium hungaricum]|uniref:MtN3 and saliva related transmembrane protein n=1 Tax=Sphingobacterium hungaricum TaxID=2082723 RepID=A0A928YNP4_9SPHI|nr:SemiSWEET transporter [Sphingobacterium hungaricum]MBE8712109.1 hypothetical protein [Sphingobacterium hungaricum]
METIIGTLAGIFTSISTLPQLFKVIKNKDVANISWMMVSVLLIGVSLWVVYGILKNELPIIISNAFSVVVNLILLGYYIAYRK